MVEILKSISIINENEYNTWSQIPLEKKVKMRLSRTAICTVLVYIPHLSCAEETCTLCLS